VAEVMADVIAHPRPEVYTHPALAELARRYADDPIRFEQGLVARVRG